MRVRSLLFAVAVAIGLFVPIQTQSAVAASASVASCYRQVGDHWECVTPGAFCPAAAHGLYGYSESGAKYQCVQDGSYWRWKPAGSSSGQSSQPSPKPTPKATPTPTPAKTKCSRAYLPLPDPRCQPGTRNPAVTQATIGTTICRPGFIAKVRPPGELPERAEGQADRRVRLPGPQAGPLRGGPRHSAAPRRIAQECEEPLAGARVEGQGQERGGQERRGTPSVEGRLRR